MAVMMILINLVVLIISGRQLASAAGFVEQVCKSTSDPPFCAKVLGSDPAGSASTTLAGLAQVAVNLGFKTASGTVVKIDSLFLTERDPQIRIRLGHCMQLYGDIKGFMTDAGRELNQKDFKSVTGRGAQTKASAQECEGAFTAGGYKSPLTDENHRSDVLGHSIGVLGSMLH